MAIAHIIHPKLIPHKCVACGEEFSQFLFLKEHMAIAHVIKYIPSVKSSTELKQRPSILRQPNENLIQIPSFRKCFQCSKSVKLSEYKLHILKFHKS